MRFNCTKTLAPHLPTKFSSLGVYLILSEDFSYFFCEVFIHHILGLLYFRTQGFLRVFFRGVFPPGPFLGVYPSTFQGFIKVLVRGLPHQVQRLIHLSFMGGIHSSA